MILLLLLFSGALSANQIQLAYLQIEEIQPANNPSNKSNIGAVKYQAMWKQPANNNNVPLSLSFSDGVSITDKASPILLNGSNIQTFSLLAKKGLQEKQITIVNLHKTNIEVMLQYRSQQSNYSIRLTPSKPSYSFEKSPSTWQTMQSYSAFGIEHILEGYDHLLFVLCLLLIASSIKKLLWAITGFTLAHSITLVLSTLNIVQLPIVVVEAIIALSIVFLATEIVKNRKDSLTFRHPVTVSSSFGLLHGFGFASVLLELGLPERDRFIALAFFNIGVEIGQLIFIGAVLLLIWFVKKHIPMSAQQIQKIKTLNTYSIGAIASMWLIERVLQF